MCDDKQGSLVGIDQIFQCIQMFKIKEHIRLVHDDKFRTDHHLTDHLDQLKLSSAEICQKVIFIVFQICNF